MARSSPLQESNISLRSRLSVQTPAAHHQRNLVGLHDHDSPMLCRMRDDLFYRRGLQCVHDQMFGRIIPQDQVNALPFELIDDLEDAVATDADTHANAIDARIVAPQCYLTAITWLARDGHDFDNPRGNFGDFLHKEPGDQAGFVVCHEFTSVPGTN
jgi:hypothetical protein